MIVTKTEGRPPTTWVLYVAFHETFHVTILKIRPGRSAPNNNSIRWTDNFEIEHRAEQDTEQRTDFSTLNLHVTQIKKVTDH